MTREEVVDKFPNRHLIYEEYDDIFNNVINEIYDDFENRTCENCKWLISNEIKRCRLDVTSNIHTHLSNGTYDERFGCNKFERKTDGDV